MYGALTLCVAAARRREFPLLAVHAPGGFTTEGKSKLTVYVLNQLSFKTKTENVLGFPVLQLNPKPALYVVNPSYPDSWSTGNPV